MTNAPEKKNKKRKEKKTHGVVLHTVSASGMETVPTVEIHQLSDTVARDGRHQ